MDNFGDSDVNSRINSGTSTHEMKSKVVTYTSCLTQVNMQKYIKFISQ